MVFFFPPFWKVFLRNISCGCQDSKPPQSSLVLGGAWNAPISLPSVFWAQHGRFPYSNSFLPFHRWWLCMASEKSIQNAFSFHYL